MSSFTDDLILRVEQREQRGLGVYTILEPFTYRIGSEGSDRAVIVPAGFDTDLASVPWFARWLIASGGLHAKAAVVHDYLYERGLITGPGGLEAPSRSEADGIFLEAMGVLLVPRWRRYLMWLAVRIGGKGAWG